MSNHPLTLLTESRYTEGVPLLKTHMAGTTPWLTVVDMESDIQLTGLKDRRDAAIGALPDDAIDEPWEKVATAKAAFLTAVYRDAKYSVAGRRYHQNMGFAQMLRGFYEGARISAEHQIGQ